MSLLLSPLLIDYHKFRKQQNNIFFSYGCTHPRAPTEDAVRDTMEDVVAGPDVRLMLENARAWSTVSRTTVAAGGSSDRHAEAFVDAVILYFLSVK